MNRIGLGFDMHPFIEGRPLILGGVTIPSDKGLEGDSDADVLAHALVDALLGAVGKGDIGRVFGVGTPEVMGISSLILLDKTYQIVLSSGYRLVNADTSIIAQKPKLTPFIPQMQEKLSLTLQTSPDRINIKSTTPKHLGDLGAGKGIAVHAVVLLEKQNLHNSDLI